ncbi:MAG: hypothetical protein K2X68_03895, partial [Novosphingobium sp.]|nr:hypothetical protein [Novosphingobium sp.]
PAIAGALALALGSTAAAAPARLPSRVFTCDVGHVVNFDATKAQLAGELKFDRRHRLVFALPSGPARKAPPPDVGEPPEKVPAGSHILSDPDHIAPQRKLQFDQVVDYWPERIELMGLITSQLRNAIVLDRIDTKSGTANLFMVRATELTHFQHDHVYQGTCTIKIVSAR